MKIVCDLRSHLGIRFDFAGGRKIARAIIAADSNFCREETGNGKGSEGFIGNTLKFLEFIWREEFGLRQVYMQFLYFKIYWKFGSQTRGEMWVSS